MQTSIFWKCGASPERREEHEIRKIAETKQQELSKNRLNLKKRLEHQSPTCDTKNAKECFLNCETIMIFLFALPRFVVASVEWFGV